MAFNEELVKDKYKNTERENSRAEWSRASGLEFIYTKKIMERYINKNSSIIEIGCATGYYGMFFADKCGSYDGVDITPENIELFDKKITAAGIKNVTARVGDATELSGIGDCAYDVVMVFGPMYHLPFEERARAIKESRRICKKGGKIAFSYISVFGAYLHGMLLCPDKYPNAEANAFVLEKGCDDLRPELFFFVTPEGIEAETRAAGLRTEKNVGVSFTFGEKTVNNMSDGQYAAYLELCDKMTESGGCAGLSEHSLLICGKD